MGGHYPPPPLLIDQLLKWKPINFQAPPPPPNDKRSTGIDKVP